MAKFTAVGSTVAVTSTSLYTGQTRRFRFHAEKPKVTATITSQSAAVAAVSTSLFDGPQSIFTVDVKGVAAGSASIVGKLPDGATATLAATVKAAPAALALPAQNTEAGMIARLLLAETRSPAYQSWTASEVKTCMEWMRLVLHNRLKWPTRFNAPSGATKLEQIVKAEGQFKGFENYPPPSSEIVSNINAIVAKANDINDLLQGKFQQHVKAAIDVANANGPVSDPSDNGMIGWRTAGSGSPGPNFAAYGGSKLGNQFYQWKSKP